MESYFSGQRHYRGKRGIDSRAGHAVVGEEKPETEDWLGKDIKDGVGDDFGIEANKAATVSNTPDAGAVSAIRAEGHNHSHWVDSPEDQSESRNSTVESLGLAILAGDRSSAVEGKLVDNDEEGKAGPGVPAPLAAIIGTESSKETSEDHDEVGNNGDEDVGSRETSHESKIREQKRCGDTPVDVSCPVYLTVRGLVRVRDMLVGLYLNNLVVANAVTAGHGEV